MALSWERIMRVIEKEWPEIVKTIKEDHSKPSPFLRQLNEGIKYDWDKIRYDLLPTLPIADIAKVLTFGANKYDDRNWEKGIDWSRIYGAMQRHLQKFWNGQDIDPESGLYHLAHAGFGILTLLEYYRTHPELDDRPRPVRKRIALDIDGVLANFAQGIIDDVQSRWPDLVQYFPASWIETKTWGMSIKFDFVFKTVKQQPTFWLNLKPHDIEVPFDPVAYVTHRAIDTEVTRRWLYKNNFPIEYDIPVITVDSNDKKVEVLKELEVDLYVEDYYKNFRMLNDAGITTYLLTRPWNERYNVGNMRINNLKGLVGEDIE